MKYFILLSAFAGLLISTVCCKSKKETTTSSSSSLTETKAVEQTYRIIVSFISKGTGVDRPKVESFLKYVETHPKKPVYEKIQWGREGEMDFCFLLTELNKSEAATFIETIKTEMKSSDMVFVTENTVAPHKKRM